ncbi:MAG TPA: PAS domain-containing protein, partial [Anaerolineae bacterium]
QALSRRLVELQEQERRALSRDLHDTSGQNITALKLSLGALKRENGNSAAVRARADELLRLADIVSEDLHRLAVNLRPASLDRYGLVPALVQLLTEFRKQSGLQVSFDAQGVAESAGRLPGDAETALYRIVQEALTNISRYAHAGSVAVVLQQRGDSVQVAVEDDGQGFDVQKALRSGRLGLLGMRERAEMAGGTLEIESSPGRGTTIYASVPGHRIEDEDEPTGRPDSIPSPTQSSKDETVPAEADARLAEAAEIMRTKTLNDALVNMTAAMARCTSADEILRVVLARSAEAIGCDNAHIARRKGDRWEILYTYQERLDREQISSLDSPAFEAVRQSHQVLIINDTGAWDLSDALRLESHHVKSYASLPLLAGDRLLGVLSFLNYSITGAFHPSEVVFLNHLAILVAPVLENVQLREVATRQRDELAQRVEELQTVLELLPAGVLIARDPDCRHIEANPAFAAIAGTPPGANVSLTAPDDERPTNYRIRRNGAEVAPDEMPMQIAASQGISVLGATYEIVREDGKVLAISGSAVPLFDAGGKSRGAIGAFVDTTDARRAQVETEAARQTLEALLRYIPEGITIADAPGATIRYTSRYGQELLGGPHTDKTAAQVVERWAVYEADGVTPMSDRDLPLVRAIRGETVADMEIVQINAQGQPISLLCNAGPIRDRDGSIAGGIVAWRDIASLKETREALRRSAAEQHAVLSAIADGLIVYDQTGRIVRMNAAAEEMLGYPPELRELSVGDRSETTTHPLKPDRSPFTREEHPVARALAGEVVRNQDMILHVPARTGGELRLSVSAAPIRSDDGTVTGCVTTFSNTEALHDATERLSQREAAFRKANAELEAILSALPDGLIVYDAEGKITRINELAIALLGYREETWDLPVDRRIPGVVQAFHPDGSPCARDEYIALRALRGEVVRNEQQYIHLPDNPEKDFWGMFSAAPIRGEEGRVLGAIATLADTTALHKIGEQLARPNDLLRTQAVDLRAAAENLELRVQERTAELRESRSQLQALARRRAEMQERDRRYVADQLYNDAGQLLAALLLQLGSFERKLGQGLASAETLAEMKGTADRVLHDLNDLATHLRPVSLDRLGLASALKQYVAQFGDQQGLQVGFATSNMERVRVPDQIETAVYRIAQEVLANVAQHAAARRVDLLLNRTGHSLVLSITDDGVGFEVGAEVRRGALGLVGLIEQAEALGGTLTIRSAPGAGTRVTARVPLPREMA